MKENELLKRIAIAKLKPDSVSDLQPKELADLVLVVLEYVKQVNKAIQEGKIKGEKGDSAITPKPDQDYLSLSTATREINRVLSEAITEIESKTDKAIGKIKNGRDGKDAVITNEQIQQAAKLAFDLIELPDFKTLITQEPDAIRNSLELLQGDERLDVSAIKGLDEVIKEVKNSSKKFGVGGIRFLSQLVDVHTTNLANNDVLKWNSTTSRWENGAGGSGSVSDTAYGSSWNGDTTTAPSKNAVYDKIEALVLGSGTGDFVGPASSTDNAIVRFDGTTGKAGQNSVVLIGDTGNITGVGTLNTHTIPGGTGTFALTSDLHSAVTVADSSEIDFTLTGQQISGSLVAGSIDETKLDASVNASLDLADSAVQDLADLGITASSTELNYTDGVTSNIQTQIDSKQYKVSLTVGPAGSNADYVCDGTDDEVQINLAITAANAAGGGIVDILAGNYTIGDLILVKSDVTIRGAGAGITVITAENEYTPTDSGYFGSYSSNMVVSANYPATTTIENVTIEGITFDMNATNKTGLTSNGQHMAIALWYGDNIRFNNNEVRDAVNWSVFFRHIDYLWVEGNHVLGGFGSTYNQNDGIHVRSCQEFHILGNHVSTINGGTSGDDSIVAGVDGSKDTRDCKNGIIANNTTRSGSAGIKLINEGTYNTTGISISNNAIYDNYRPAIIVVKISNGSGVIKNINIEGNVIENYGVFTGSGVNQGILVYQSSGTVVDMFENISINNNTVRKSNGTNDQRAGISVIGKGKGLTVNGNNLSELTGTRAIEIGTTDKPVTDVVISGNNVDSSTCANDQIAFFLVGVSRSQVTGNIVKGNTGGTTQAMRLVATGTMACDYNNINNNQIYNFDVGIREANSGADPNNNLFVNNQFISVTTPYTVLGTATKLLADSGTNWETNKTVTPLANDGAALGTTALGFSDLHLATGAVINFASDSTITHSSALLTLGSSALTIARDSGTALYIGTNANNTTGLSLNGRGLIGYDSIGGNVVIQGGTSKGVLFAVNNTTLGSGGAGRVTSAGNFILGAESALATTATDGFMYIPTCAGVPTGVPTAYTGKVAMVFDTTNNNLYTYNAGWFTPSGGVSDGDKGDITVSSSGTVWNIDAATVGLTELSATGTPSASTFLRGDNTWATPAGSGDVVKVGTPVNNQVGVWTGDGTIEGDTALTFDTTTDTLSTVDLSLSNDLLLASGSIINFNASDVTLTHAANALTIAGGIVTISDTNRSLTLGDGTSATAYMSMAGTRAMIGYNSAGLATVGSTLIQATTGKGIEFAVNNSTFGSGVVASITSTVFTSTVPLTVGTSNAITAGTIELGAASDTTISRSSAGVLAVEGVVIPSISSTNTLTNKTIAAGSNTITGLTDSNFDSAADVLLDSKGITIDGGGSAPTTGSKGFLEIPYNCTIVSATMLADASGSAVIDVKKSTYSGFPTTSSICASAKPTLSSAQKSQDTTLTGWTTTLSAGDILEFNLDSASTLTRVTLSLKLRRT